MGSLEVSASTFSYLYSHRGFDALKHLNRMGYVQFEMMVYPPHCWPNELTASARREVSSWLDGEGCRLTSFVYPLIDNNPNSVDRLMREYTLDRYREAIDLAAEWRCPYAVVIPGAVFPLVKPPRQWVLDWFLESMNSLLSHSRGSGVQLLIENMPFTFLPAAADMKEVSDLIGPEAGVNFDVCNSAYLGEDVGEAIRMLGPLIKNVHVSDTGRNALKHDRLGTGIVDPAPVAEALRDIAYTGATVLEIITDPLVQGTDPDEDIRVSHAVLEKHGWMGIGSITFHSQSS